MGFPHPNQIQEKRSIPQVKYQGGATPLRSNTRTGTSHSDQIPGRSYLLKATYCEDGTPPGRIPGICYSYRASTTAVSPLETKYQERDILFRSSTKREGRPFRSHTRAALSLKSEIRGRGYPSRSNTRAGESPPDRIPGRRYTIGGNTRAGGSFQIKYQRGAAPFRSITRSALPFRGKLPGWGRPSKSDTREKVPSLRRIPGRRYPIQIKYHRADIPFRSNTRTALSSKSEIPGNGYPPGPNTRDRMPPTGQIPERCYYLEAKYMGVGYPIQIKY